MDTFSISQFPWPCTKKLEPPSATNYYAHLQSCLRSVAIHVVRFGGPYTSFDIPSICDFSAWNDTVDSEDDDGFGVRDAAASMDAF